MKRSQSTRRDFLKTSAAAGIGFWVANSYAAEESTSPNDKIRFACIGYGSKGKEDFKDASKFGDVVAICEIDDQRLSSAGDQFPKAARFQDWREMFDEMAGSIDAVTVSTPDHNHAVIAANAMRLGKHAFVQKPLTHNLYEARMLGQIARENKVATQMGNQFTADSNLRKLAAMVRGGALGAVSEIHIWTNRPVWPQGAPRSEEKPLPAHVHWKLFLGPAPYRPYGDNYHPYNWRGWWDFGTGSLGDMACHTMNMPFMALDLRDPISVQAESSGHDRDFYPSRSKVTYEFAANDRHPALTLHWYDAKQKPPRELFAGRKGEQAEGDAESEGKAKKGGAGAIYQSGALLIGEKGKLYAPGDYAERPYEFIGVEAPSDVQFVKSPGHFAEFARAVRGGETAMSNFPDYAVPLTETVLLGNLAIWMATEPDTPSKKIQWDARNLSSPNAPEVAQLVKYNYRPGYSL